MFISISMQERDALLAGLYLLKAAIQGNTLDGDSAGTDLNHAADLLRNGGTHEGLGSDGIDTLADFLVNEFPNPPVNRPPMNEQSA